MPLKETEKVPILPEFDTEPATNDVQQTMVRIVVGYQTYRIAWCVHHQAIEECNGVIDHVVVPEYVDSPCCDLCHITLGPSVQNCFR